MYIIHCHHANTGEVLGYYRYIYVFLHTNSACRRTSSHAEKYPNCLGEQRGQSGHVGHLQATDKHTENRTKSPRHNCTSPKIRNL